MGESKFKGIELAGKTLGVIGLGRIGSEVARKCQAMAMNVIAYDPYINPDAHLSSGLELVDLQRIFEQADFITVHVPLSESTRNLINERTIAHMKDGVRILNCARGGIVNESDLYAALKSGKVGGAPSMYSRPSRTRSLRCWNWTISLPRRILEHPQLRRSGRFLRIFAGSFATIY